MFFKSISSVFLLLMCGFVFNAICAASPLMVEKNLFSTDRKAPSPESSDASSKPAKPGMALGNFQLDGVIMQSGEKRAVLRMKSQPADPSGKKGQPPSPFITVREGQMVSDYRVSKIEPKSISLEKEGQTFTIGLFAASKILSPIAQSPPQPPAPVEQPPEVETEQPPDVQAQAVMNPQNPRQPLAGQPPMPRGRNRPVPNPNMQVNVQDPAEQVAQDPNQPVETVEEE